MKMDKKESETIEFKKSTSELKEAIISIVSILNKHQKGELYFGIRNNGEVVGHSIGEKTIRDISKSISDHIEPKFFPKIKEMIIEGKNCILIEFEGLEIPYFAYGRAYIRVADEDKQISAKELEKIFLGKNENLWERQFSERKMKEIDKNILKNFVERANKVKRINFEYTNVRDVLLKLHLLKNDKLLRAGEVLFCKGSDYEVQAAVFAGKDKLTFLDISNFKGSLFILLDKSISYIKEHMDWRAKLTGEGRKEIPEIPIRAIEEAVVNSLCHRDYGNVKANEIAFYQDRIEIYNPGQFPEGHTPKEYIQGKGESILRNPLIANTLFLSKNIERWGSGIKRIYEACKEEGVEVEFKEVKTGFKVIFYRKKTEGKVIERTKEKTEKDTIRDTIKDTIKKLSENEGIIFIDMMENPRITAEELSQKLNINLRNTKRNIEKLKQKGLLKRVGSRKAGYWEAVKKEQNEEDKKDEVKNDK